MPDANCWLCRSNPLPLKYAFLRIFTKFKNPELLNELASVNFFGLTPNVIFFLEESVINFKKENVGDRKIECILPNALSEIIENRRVTMHCFEIKNKICGVTYPGDEKNVKNIIITNIITNQ